MKLFVKMMLLVLVVAISGPYFLKGPDGAPLWSVQDTLRNVSGVIDRMRATPLANVVPVGNEAVEVFRWQDAEGQWHFSNVAPGDLPHSVLRIDPRTNAISTVIEKDTEDTAGDPDIEDPMAQNTHIGPLPDPETAKALIDDARALQRLADDRARLMENIE